ncbi:MAG: Glutamate 5-kinase [Parcubacteria group bacterium GW2011_GWA2_43_9b]|nr:MAG: Glutamate 5-kinase [Parcubacteria group bacterium GW2011_GWA2_43_9b]
MYNGSMLIGIKVGSSLLTDDKGVSSEYIASLCRQIAELKSLGHRVFLVTSGAVASESFQGFSDNLRAAIGQVALMSEYRKFFEVFNLKAAQFLVNDADLRRDKFSRKEPVGFLTFMEVFSHKSVVPIINANDVTSYKELEALSVCADNDRLSKLICERLGTVDIMIIGMDEEGLRDESGNIMRQISPRAQIHESIDNLDLLLSFVNGCSEKGHGSDGMRTKISVAYRLAERGIKVVLAPGREKDFILRAVAGEENFGTTFCRSK